MEKHFLQTEFWAAVRAKQGHQPVWINNNLLLVKQTPLGGFGYMPQVQAARIDYAQLVKQAKELNLSHILVDPADLDSTPLPKVPNSVPAESLYYRHTCIVDLMPDLDQILERMKPKWRYNAKLGGQKGVVVEVSDTDEVFEIFCDLFFKTVARQKYFGRDKAYYEVIWNTLRPQGKVKIAVAKYQGQPLTAWMLYLGEQTVYYPYGGSSESGRDLMPGHALVWGIIQWAKAAGFKQFDLWGTLGPAADEQSPQYGFHRFKMGFGGTEISYAASFVVVISAWRYGLFRLANSLRWLLLRLSKALK